MHWQDVARARHCHTANNSRKGSGSPTAARDGLTLGDAPRRRHSAATGSNYTVPRPRKLPSTARGPPREGAVAQPASDSEGRPPTSSIGPLSRLGEILRASHGADMVESGSGYANGGRKRTVLLLRCPVGSATLRWRRLGLWSTPWLSQAVTSREIPAGRFLPFSAAHWTCKTKVREGVEIPFWNVRVVACARAPRT